MAEREASRSARLRYFLGSGVVLGLGVVVLEISDVIREAKSMVGGWGAGVRCC